MLKTHFERQFAYNRWAWGEIFKSVEQLDSATYKQEMGYFWGSIHVMMVHGLSAEYVWRERCMGSSPTALFNAADFADFAAVREKWLPEMDAFHAWLTQTDEDTFGRTIKYKSTKGTPRSCPLSEILQHVVNHATEHRSHISPVLYNLGYPTISLDFMYFCVSTAGGNLTDWGVSKHIVTK